MSMKKGVKIITDKHITVTRVHKSLKILIIMLCMNHVYITVLVSQLVSHACNLLNAGYD